MLLFVVLVSIFTLPINGELPTELDAFLEKLFDTSECEDFLSSGDFLSVATVECAPFTCDFPRQLCMRPADKYQDKGANVCKDLPTECVTAANGGVPLGPSLGPKGTLTLPGIPAPPSPSMVTLPPFPGLGPAPPVPGVPHPNKVINPNNVRPRDICEMGPPTGRFCGFTQKFVYNKDTGDCDEFWFPGCKTEETNANIFDTRRQCERIAEICARLATPAPTTPAPRPKPHPRRGGGPGQGPQGPQGPFGGFGGGPEPGALGPFGGGGETGGGGPLGALSGLIGGGLGGPNQGGGGGQGGALGGGGGQGAGAGGEQGGQQGLLGLITQGLMSAKQIKETGKGALPQVAAQQAQSWLNQFGFEGIPNLFG